MKKYLILLSLIFFSINVFSKKIKIHHSKVFKSFKINGVETRILTGKVKLEHKRNFLYCDSATIINNDVMEAFGNVKLIKDSTNISSDYLFYNGAEDLADFKGNCIIFTKQNKLYTNELIFNLETKVAVFNDKGKMVGPDLTLNSDKGEFYTEKSIGKFIENVVFKSSEYSLFNQELYYDSKKDLAFYHVPSEIKSQKEYIYSEEGNYYKKNKRFEIFKNAYILIEKQKIVADSIEYFSDIKKAIARNNVKIEDTANKVNIYGNYSYVDKKDNYGFITKRAYIEKFSKDTTYASGDTIWYYSDSLGNNKRIIFKNKSQVFKNNLQSISDSIIYESTSNTIKLMGNPVLWSKENQITSESMLISIDSVNQIKFVDFLKEPFLVSQNDTFFYNQIIGKEMRANFFEGKIKTFVVKNDVNTIYFIKEKPTDSVYIGINRATSKELIAYMDSGRLHEVKYFGSPKGNLSPLYTVNRKDMIFPHFKWLGDLRPTEFKDIFVWKKDFITIIDEEEKAGRKRRKIVKNNIDVIKVETDAETDNEIETEKENKIEKENKKLNKKEKIKVID